MKLRADTFGYERDVHSNLVTIPEQMAVLEVFEEYYDAKAMSLRDGVDFLYEQTGRRVSHEGLRMLLKFRKRDSEGSGDSEEINEEAVSR